jgi:hypothetical protein
LGAVRVSDDAMLQTVVEFGAAVNGSVPSAGGLNGCDEFDSRLFHQSDSSKDAVIGR